MQRVTPDAMLNIGLVNYSKSMSYEENLGKNATSYMAVQTDATSYNNGVVNSTVSGSEINIPIAIVTGILMFILNAVIIAGNLLVILTVVKLHNMRSVTNCIIASLALSDLMMGILILPFAAVNEVLGYWVFGKYCDFHTAADILFCTASIIHLCMISADRYTAITQPFDYHRKITHKTAAIMIAVTWFISVLISFPPIYAGWWRDPNIKSYNDPWLCAFMPNADFALISSLCSFYVPLFCMCFMYIRIFTVALRQARQIDSMECNLATSHNMPRLRNILRRERRAAKTLGIIMGVFIFCWLPFFLMNIINHRCGRCYPPALVTVFIWLGYANSAANPFIYAFNKEFR